MKVIIEKVPLPSLTEILDAMQVEASSVDWFVAEAEGYPWPVGINNQWLTGKELDALFSERKPTFSWGVFSAVRATERPPVTTVPFADGNGNLWTSTEYGPQILGAQFEVVFWDSTAIIVTGLSDSQGKSITSGFLDARSG